MEAIDHKIRETKHIALIFAEVKFYIAAIF